MGFLDKFRKLTPKPNWGMSPIQNPEDFIEESLDDYETNDTSVLLSIAKDLIPEKHYDKVFVAGGFASYFAGITNEYNDIDLFCLNGRVFDLIADRIKHGSEFTVRFGDGRPVEIESRGYGRILKFIYEGIKFDLVDSYIQPIQDLSSGQVTLRNLEDIRDLLSVFDFNWTMTGIDFANHVVVCHTGVFSSVPQVNGSRIDVCLEGTIDRIVKYRNRLIRQPDMAAYELILEKLKERLQKQQKEEPQNMQAKAMTSYMSWLRYES